MASLFEMLSEQLGGSTVQDISRKLGTDEKATKTAMAAAVPTLLEALSRNAATTDGAQGLHKAIARDHDGSLLDNLSGYIERGEGNERAIAGDRVVNHMLGSKRNRVEAGVSQLSGLDAGASSKLLSMLAPIVMGALGRQQRQQKMDTGQLTDFLGKEKKSFESGDPKQASLFGRMLDQDGDGDFDASDMMRLGSSVIGRMFKG